MSSPEEIDIMATLISRLEGISGSPFVSRNLRLLGTLTAYPAIFVVVRPDEVKREHGRPTPLLDREMFVSTVTVIQGSTEALAPSELATYRKAVKKAIYEDERCKLGEYAKIKEWKSLEEKYPAQGNKVIARETIWRIKYREDVKRLFA